MVGANQCSGTRSDFTEVLDGQTDRQIAGTLGVRSGGGEGFGTDFEVAGGLQVATSLTRRNSVDEKHGVLLHRNQQVPER
jgi:hypothetical protein